MTYLPALTPLRGIAALLIVLLHFSGSVLPNLGLHAYTMLISNGYLAVDLFFLMSGVVIAHVYGQELGRGLSYATSAAFLRARFARLYPLHFCTLAYLLFMAVVTPFLYSLATGAPYGLAGEGRYTLETTIKNLLLIHGMWNEHLTWNYPSWSISTEFFAYLAFPFAAPLLATVRRGMALAGIAVLFAALWWLAHEQGSLDIVTGPSFLRCVLQFGIGTLLHRLYLEGTGIGILRRDEVFMAAVLAIVAALHFNLADILVIPLFMILILSGIHNEGRVLSALQAPPLVRLGDLSFSLYMTHAVVDKMTRTLLALITGHHDGRAVGTATSWLVLAAMLIFVFALSDATYRRIEVPARRWLKSRTPGPVQPAATYP
ncbi:MAG: acyltransferase [Inquilinus sp.]|nr:acyltransferase [Inquilinus sp.]